MRKLLVAAALASLMAPGRLHAQLAPEDRPIEIPGRHGPPDHDAGPGAHGPRRPRLFVSPSGEPFRGPGGLEAWFAQADTDHDGAISRAEFEADALRAFRLYDANNDGVIDGFEIQAYEQDRVPEIGEIPLGGEEGGPGGRGRRGHGRRGGGPPEGGLGGGGSMAGAGGAPGEEEGARKGEPMGAGRDGAARFSLLNEPQPLLAADEDVDGKVTLAEWKHATARRFDKLDRDHTGKLTLQMLKAPAPKK